MGVVKDPRIFSTNGSRLAESSVEYAIRLARLERGGGTGGAGAVDTTPFVRKDTLLTKGDIFVATSSATVVRLQAPPMDGSADGWVLTVDSAETTGLRWGPIPGAPSPIWDVTNYAVDRTYDANATTLNELGDIFGTLVMDDLPVPIPAYTITNGTTDKVLDTNATTVSELADVLYSAITDLAAGTGAGTYTVTNVTETRTLNVDAMTMHILADAIGTMLQDEGLA